MPQIEDLISVDIFWTTRYRCDFRWRCTSRHNGYFDKFATREKNAWTRKMCRKCIESTRFALRQLGRKPMHNRNYFHLMLLPLLRHFGRGQIFWLQANSSVWFGTPLLEAQNDKFSRIFLGGHRPLWPPLATPMHFNTIKKPRILKRFNISLPPGKKLRRTAPLTKLFWIFRVGDWPIGQCHMGSDVEQEAIWRSRAGRVFKY